MELKDIVTSEIARSWFRVSRKSINMNLIEHPPVHQDNLTQQYEEKKEKR